MDNAIVVDGVLAAVLIFGTVYGAYRGLIKSLAGLVAVVAALIGSVMLANLLTEPVTDIRRGGVRKCGRPAYAHGAL